MSSQDNFESTFDSEMDRLKEYIDSRKVSLEEEIEGTIHQALADAKDSLELIRENIDPKVDKIVRNKMDLIDNKMENWKKDFRFAAQEEVQAGEDDLLKKILNELNTVVDEKISILKDDLRKLIQEEVKTVVAPKLEGIEAIVAEQKNKTLIALGISALAFIAVIALKFSG